MTKPSLRVDVHDRVAVVTLDDPDRRNALNLTMNGELIAAMDHLEERADVGAIVITGAGRAFCAGADLDELRSSADHDRITEIYAGFLRVAHARVPTVAAVNGAAVGAGMNMALACDVIVAGRSARFDSRFLDIGIHPGGGHTWRLRNRTDEQTVMAMVIFGEVLDGDEAARRGLAWTCVDDDALLDTARRLATRAASHALALVRRTKATITQLARVRDSDDAVAHELDPQVWSMRQPAFQELVASLQQRISGRDA
jgi:enoyl-CoA hydratase